MAELVPTTNLVRLPTAAKHKVQQPSFRKRRALRAELPQHPAKFIPHYARDEQRLQAELPARTPALVIAAALFATADKEHQSRAFGCVHLMDQAHPSNVTLDALRMMGLAFNLGDAAAALRGSASGED